MTLGIFPDEFLSGVQSILDQYDQQRRSNGSAAGSTIMIPDAIRAAIHPHASCPYCGPSAYSAKCAAGVSDEELIAWFVKHGWRESKSELVERLKREFIITKKEKS